MLFQPKNKSDLENKIRHLIGNTDLVLEMGKNARNTAEKEYNPNLHYEKLINLYKKVTH